MNLVRSYAPSDYNQVKKIYLKSDLYGGQFDDHRDSEERLKSRIEADPDAILVAERDGNIVGTVSLIEDGRVAWLFRFAVLDTEAQDEVATSLFDAAKEILVGRGHHQILVYSPVGNENLNKRYKGLGFIKGNDYTCYWRNI